MQFYFLDTNLFLQCRPLADLDWRRFSGSEEVTLLISSVVLAELDKHKADGNNRRAQRARAALKFLDALLASDAETFVVQEKPVRVLARFAPELPNDEGQSNDDSILLEVAAMALAKGQGVCALITHDTNLKVKARRRGLTFFAVPDEWLLQPEPDERDKRVRQLEEQVARLSRQYPAIEIGVVGDVASIEMTVPDYAPLAPSVVARLRDAIRARYPMKTDFSLTPYEALPAFSGFGRKRPPPDWEIEKYHEKYLKWEERIGGLLEGFHSALRFRESTIDVGVLVSNTGGTPAEYVEVEIEASAGLVLARPTAFPKLIQALLSSPKPPSPPEPRTELDDLVRHTRLGELGFFSPPHPKGVEFRRDRDEFYVKEGDDVGTKWVWEAEHMRHGKPPRPFDAKLGLHAQARPSGGQISVVVSAVNMSEEQRRQFPVRIRYTPADTETAANKWLGVI